MESSRSISYTTADSAVQGSPSQEDPNTLQNSTSAPLLHRIPLALYRFLVVLVLIFHCYCSFKWLGNDSNFNTLQLILVGTAVVYGTAFLSLALQVNGLVDAKGGIFPVDEFLAQIPQHSLQLLHFHIRVCIKCAIFLWKLVCKYQFLHAHHIAWLGLLLVVAVINLQFRYPINLTTSILKAFIFFALYILYLSFRLVGQDFLSFQWDNLMLEMGWLATLGALCGSTVSSSAAMLIIACYRLLVFKVVFCSGVCKFVSGCPYWSSHSALNYYFSTQPLPNPLSYVAHWQAHKKLLSFLTSILECGISFLIFGSRESRLAAAFAYFGFALCIFASGNYGFLSFLMGVATISLLDDALLTLISFSFNDIHPVDAAYRSFLGDFTAALLFLFALSWWLLYTIANGYPLIRLWRRSFLQPPRQCAAAYDFLAPLSICNCYGLFAPVNTHRFEIVIEECHYIGDVKLWIELKFPYKPGDVNRRPPTLWWGHFPRLDWRMWFVPIYLIKRSENVPPVQTAKAFPPYWLPFLQRVYQREPSVIHLLGPQDIDLIHAPPPLSTRIRLYEYRFAPPPGTALVYGLTTVGTALSSQRAEQLKVQLGNWEVGQWWMRQCVFVMDVTRLLLTTSSTPPY